MGLLDQVVGALSGGASGLPQGVTPQQHAGLGGMVLDMLSGSGGSGGLAGLAQSFNQQGLGHLVASWIGTGQNLPVTPEQISQVLGSEQVRSMAAKIGVSPEAAGSVLASILPKLVDKATPAGQIPQEGALQDGLGALRKTLGV
jgi:uncharacterized protein YidB (DUF937 family)